MFLSTTETLNYLNNHTWFYHYHRVLRCLDKSQFSFVYLSENIILFVRQNVELPRIKYHLHQTFPFI